MTLGHTTLGADPIVQLLTHRQHTHPHQTVRWVMERATAELGCCPQAIARASEWLQIDLGRAVGRLRRAELLQLARAVHRFWRESQPQAASAKAGSTLEPTCGLQAAPCPSQDQDSPASAGD